MGSQDRRAATAEGIVDYLALAAAVPHHAGDEFDRLRGRVKFAQLGFIDLKDVILCAVVGEVVSGVWQPAIQNRLVAVMVIGHADYEMMLDPCQLSAVGEAGRGKCLNEVD